MPTLTAATGLVLAVLSFTLYEQRGLEQIGLVIRGLALLSVAMFLSAAWRGWRLYRRTQETMALWMTSAEPVAVPAIDVPVYSITSAFPIVAVIGLLQQRIIIARSVLERCSQEELVAILAHEQAHIRRYDNIRRALFTVAPDPLSWLPLSDRLLAAWHERCEEAADNGASKLGECGRLLLAQALIRVARLAPTAPAVHDLPASALYRGEDLNRRIHRLLVAAGGSCDAGSPRRLRHGVRDRVVGGGVGVAPRGHRDRGPLASLRTDWELGTRIQSSVPQISDSCSFPKVLPLHCRSRVVA